MFLLPILLLTILVLLVLLPVIFRGIPELQERLVRVGHPEPLDLVGLQEQMDPRVLLVHLVHLVPPVDTLA